MTNRSRLDSVYQYIVAVAAFSDDFRQRQLGPIHLLKYAYLADVAHAERNDGNTFSGVEWRFHHFGPWNEEAFEEISPALLAVSASKSQCTSRFENDFVRYRLETHDAENIARKSADDLPLVVFTSISQAVHEHGSDTADLLRHVYLTKPMLAARPGDVLDFRTAMTVARETSPPTEAPRMSARKKRQRSAIVESARAGVMARLAAKRVRRVEPRPAPRYDAVFTEGTTHLDRLAGDPLTSISGEISFDDSVWHSSQRRDDPDLP